MMLVHLDDTRTPQFPAGWMPAMDEPLFFNDTVVWLLVEAG